MNDREAIKILRAAVLNLLNCEAHGTVGDPWCEAAYFARDAIAKTDEKPETVSAPIEAR